MEFKEFGLHDKVMEAISFMNFEVATPIQEKTIPITLEGKDIIGCAQTGTGKTAAFLLPVLHHLASDEEGSGVRVLIIVPTRELCIQIVQQIQGFSYFAGVSSIAIYGGGDGKEWGQEKAALQGGVDIVVATPGKLIAHLNMGYVKFNTIKYLILDEADRMLDIGFHDDILKIISFIPKERQTLMFSATMPFKIKRLAHAILNKPVEISTEISKPPSSIKQSIYLTYDKQKVPLLCDYILNQIEFERVIIFCSTKRKVFEIVRTLKKRIPGTEGISSDFEQREREEVLVRFKSRETPVLVATDVMSRGIDVQDIDLVVNYDVPGDAEDYVHRIGRTARAEKKGAAITFVNKEDMHKIIRIEQLIEKEIKRNPMPEELGPAPEWNAEKTRSPRSGGGGFNKRKKGNFRQGKQGKPRSLRS